MTRFASASLMLALVASTAAPALADAQSDLTRALRLTEAARSYHMSMTSSHGMSMQGDVITPSTMHVTMGGGMEMINVAGKMFMRHGGGAWRAFPGGGLTDSDVLQILDTHRAEFRASDLGMKLVDGQTLHAYRVQNLKSGHPETVYLDGAGRIVRVDAPSMSARFSNFGESVRIVAPM